MRALLAATMSQNDTLVSCGVEQVPLTMKLDNCTYILTTKARFVATLSSLPSPFGCEHVCRKVQSHRLVTSPYLAMAALFAHIPNPSYALLPLSPLQDVHLCSRSMTHSQNTVMERLAHNPQTAHNTIRMSLCNVTAKDSGTHLNLSLIL